MAEEIILDTNFILTCVKQKIDLFSQLKELFGNPRILIPQQVFDELKMLSEKKSLTLKEKSSAKLSIDIINKNLIFIIDLKTPNVDAGIINFADKSNEKKIIVGTLDRELKKKIKNPKTRFLTIKNKKRIAEL